MSVQKKRTWNELSTREKVRLVSIFVGLGFSVIALIIFLSMI